MSGNIDKMQLRQDDVLKFLACQTYLGAQNVDFQMEQYVYKRRPDGVFILNVKKTWEKILLAARAIAAIDNPADVCVISARPYGQRAILKFATHTGATPIAGRFTPGTFTNQIQSAFREPRLLVVTDPRTDHQAITEASYVNIPVIAMCNTDSPLKLVNIAIPCNNKGIQSIGLLWWMLAREVLILRGSFTREMGFRLDNKEIMLDLYFYRDPEDVAEKEKKVEKAKEEPTYTEQNDWGQELTQPAVTDWAVEPEGSRPAIPSYHGPPEVAPVQDWAAETQMEWANQQQKQQQQPPRGDMEWGGGGQQDWQ